MRKFNDVHQPCSHENELLRPSRRNVPLSQDVEHAGPEESKGEENEETVGGLAAAILADQLPTLLRGSNKPSARIGKKFPK